MIFILAPTCVDEMKYSWEDTSQQEKRLTGGADYSIVLRRTFQETRGVVGAAHSLGVSSVVSGAAGSYGGPIQTGPESTAISVHGQSSGDFSIAGT